MVKMKAESIKEPPLFRLDYFKGINVSVSPTQIEENQSPDLLNVTLDERGALRKRTGYDRVYPTSLGAGQINGMFLFRKKDGSTVFLLAHGTNLYTQSGTSQPVSIYSSLANHKVNFFVMGGKCYIQDGTNFLVYDGETVKNVESNPYIPKLTISRTPTGGGKAYEDFNLLGSGFKDSFSGDGTAKEYQLSLTGLDATTVKAEVGTTTITEGSGLTVNRATGVVTFSTAPASGTNNVIITAYKTPTGFKDRIKKCQFNVIYGGSNDTRVLVSGNPEYKNQIWACGLQDPSYWPENSTYKPGNDNESIQGFSKQYDYLVIEKEFSKWNMTFELNDGEPSFPMKPINDQIGTFARGTIQVTENNPVSLSKDGVYMLVSSMVRDERNVIHISEAVDRYLLNETGLENAISVDFDKKYWIAINGKVYVLDYHQKSKGSPYGEWTTFDNIQASCFIEMGGFLYFGSSTEGLIYRFKKVTTDSNPFHDDNEPIHAYWKSKPFTFGRTEFYKNLHSMWLVIKPSGKTSVDISYESNKQRGELNDNAPVTFNLFDFSQLDFHNFTFHFSSFPQTIKRKVKVKKITHFQLVLENNKLDEDFTVLSLAVKFRYQGKIR